ncbi:hypothetical protein CR513_17827, partial [Mucuna pruriens]
MKRMFLEKFFPASKTATIRKEIWHKGLIMMDRSMIDASSGGALMDKTPIATRNLISNMEIQQHNSSPSLEDLVKQMATSNIQFQQNVTNTI